MKRTMSVILILIFTTLALSSCDDYTIRIDDIDMFINETYYSNDDQAEWWKKKAGKNAKRFFPEYEELQYEYTDINFYVYSCAGFTFPDATLVLELKFDDVEKYEKAKTEIYSNYNFLETPVRENSWPYHYIMPQTNFEIGDFLVKITTQGSSEDAYPHQVFTVCENDKEYIIRYMFLYCEEQDILTTNDFINGVGNCTNCEW